jgi:signal peptidase I
MENKIIKKEAPMFSVADFKDFSSLILKFKASAASPIYKGLSPQTLELISQYSAGNEVNKKLKKAICEDFNSLIRVYDLSTKLAAFYGQSHLEAKLTQATKAYRDSLGFLGEPLEKLGSFEKAKIQWLNLYTLNDLYAEQIHKIKRKGQVQAWLEALIVAAALVIFVRTFFFQIYKIPTTSMIPTLMPGDKIFVSKLTYGPKIPFTKLRLPGFKKPEAGEVIVFVPPHERNKFYIKRLVGFSGDRILLKDGNLYVNGKKMVDPRFARNYYYNQGLYGKEGKEIVVPTNKFFFLGDNSIQSLDARFWGFVDEWDIIGKAIFIWWPPKRIAMIE